MRMLVFTVTTLILFSCSLAAQAPNQTRPRGYFVVIPGSGNVGPPFEIHITAGGEGFFYRGFALGADLGPLFPAKTQPFISRYDDLVGLGSLNLSYHLLPKTPDRKLEPFITGGYSLFFRAGTFDGYNIGGGTNLWLSDGVAIRVEGRVHSTSQYRFAGFGIGMTFR